MSILLKAEVLIVNVDIDMVQLLNIESLLHFYFVGLIETSARFIKVKVRVSM